MAVDMKTKVVEWCGYFWNPQEKECCCKMWRAGHAVDHDGQKCPVLDAGNPAFVPEPVRGNPVGKNIIFLAANPGGGGPNRNPLELSTCPWWDAKSRRAGAGEHAGQHYDWAGVLATPAAFAEFHFMSNARAAEDASFREGYRYDRPTRAAAGVVLLLSHPDEAGVEICPEVSSRHFRDSIGDVALLNVAHCKSGGWQGGEAVLHGACGEETWRLIEIVNPPAVVSFGEPAWALLTDRAAVHQYALDVVEHPAGDRVVRHSPVSWNGGGVTHLFGVDHPAHNWFNERSRNVLLGLLRQILHPNQR